MVRPASDLLVSGDDCFTRKLPRPDQRLNYHLTVKYGRRTDPLGGYDGAKRDLEHALAKVETEFEAKTPIHRMSEQGECLRSEATEAREKLLELSTKLEAAWAEVALLCKQVAGAGGREAELLVELKVTQLCMRGRHHPRVNFTRGALIGLFYYRFNNRNFDLRSAGGFSLYGDRRLNHGTAIESYGTEG
ncbi:hypothetical protein ACLOJK_009067 [Asimina triloba]